MVSLSWSHWLDWVKDVVLLVVHNVHACGAPVELGGSLYRGSLYRGSLYWSPQYLCRRWKDLLDQFSTFVDQYTWGSQYWGSQFVTCLGFGKSIRGALGPDDVWAHFCGPEYRVHITCSIAYATKRRRNVDCGPLPSYFDEFYILM